MLEKGFQYKAYERLQQKKTNYPKRVACLKVENVAIEKS
jgi:hypothetical protein